MACLSYHYSGDVRVVGEPYHWTIQKGEQDGWNAQVAVVAGGPIEDIFAELDRRKLAKQWPFDA